MVLTADAVIEIVAKEAGIDPAALHRDATLAGLDIGSLDVVSAAFEIEDRFGVVLEPETIQPDWTVGQLVDHVVSLVAE